MNYTIEDIMESAKELTTKPEIVVQTEKLLMDPEVSFNNVANVISKDPGLAARVFKVANSCFFGRLSKAKTLTEAIVTIGIKGLYSLVLVHTIKEYYKASSRQDMSYWNHAVCVSVTSLIIAAETGFVKTEDVMISGLLHDVGKDIMRTAVPQDYEDIVLEVDRNDVTYAEAEQDVFGFTHAEVGYKLANRWDFPEHIQMVILYHHNLDTAEKKAPNAFRLTSIVNLADTFCRRFELRLKKPQNGFSWGKVVSAKILGFSEEQLTELEPEIRNRIEEERGLFD